MLLLAVDLSLHRFVAVLELNAAAVGVHVVVQLGQVARYPALEQVAQRAFQLRLCDQRLGLRERGFGPLGILLLLLLGLVFQPRDFQRELPILDLLGGGGLFHQRAIPAGMTRCGQLRTQLQVILQALLSGRIELLGDVLEPGGRNSWPTSNHAAAKPLRLAETAPCRCSAGLLRRQAAGLARTLAASRRRARWGGGLLSSRQ